MTKSSEKVNKKLIVKPIFRFLFVLGIIVPRVKKLPIPTTKNANCESVFGNMEIPIINEIKIIDRLYTR
jgi:hypothetical protein